MSAAGEPPVRESTEQDRIDMYARLLARNEREVAAMVQSGQTDTVAYRGLEAMVQTFREMVEHRRC